jgi:hypothetical protein
MIDKHKHKQVHDLQLAKAKRKINASTLSSVKIQIHILANNHIL